MRYTLIVIPILVATLLLAVVYSFASVQAQPASPRLTATSTPTATPAAVFSVTVEVVPARTHLAVGETLTVVVTIDNHSLGCQYPVFDLTLSQQGGDAPIFDFLSPPVVGPPVYATTWYTLSAALSGTITLGATAYGERNCGDGWIWTYVAGESVPVTVGPYEVSLPLILR